MTNRIENQRISLFRHKFREFDFLSYTTICRQVNRQCTQADLLAAFINGNIGHILNSVCGRMVIYLQADRISAEIELIHFRFQGGRINRYKHFRLQPVDLCSNSCLSRCPGSQSSVFRYCYNVHIAGAPLDLMRSITRYRSRYCIGFFHNHRQRFRIQLQASSRRINRYSMIFCNAVF